MNNIRLLRKERKLTLKELGDMCDISEAQMSKIENGKRKPSMEVLLKLADALGCSSDEILGRDAQAFDVEYFGAPIVLTELERDIIEKYRSLDERGRRAVEAVIDAQADFDDYRMVARSGRKISPDQMETARKVLKAMEGDE